MELRGEIVRPQALPQTENIRPFKLTLVPDEKHAEEEKEIGRVGGLEVQVEFRIEQLDKMVESSELSPHTSLVTYKIPGHAPHEPCKSPECNRVVLHYCVDGGEKIRHALHIAKVLGVRIAGVGADRRGEHVVFKVGKKHVFELLEMDIGTIAARDVKRRGWVRMWDVFASEQRYVAVGPVHVLLYGANGQVSGTIRCCSSKNDREKEWAAGDGAVELTDPTFLFFPPLLLFRSGILFYHSFPPDTLQSNEFVSL